MDGRNDSGRLRVFNENPASYFERGFTEIAQTRMKGLPILNPKLQVHAAEFRRWQNDWIGTLVLPWAVVAIYACGNRASWQDVGPGRKRTIELPCGDFAFDRIDDSVLGIYYMLSLKSPVQDIGDQPTADLMAKICLDTMLKVSQIPADDEDAVVIPETPKGSLRRVIPIRMVPPKEDTPRLTPQPPEEKKDEPSADDTPFFDRPMSRRELFGRGPDPEDPPKPHPVAAIPNSSEK